MSGTVTFRLRFTRIARASLAALGVCALPLLLIAETQTGVTGNGTPIENRQPTQALRYIIAVPFGAFPDDAATVPNQTQQPDRSNPFLGEIRAVPYNIAPRGWMFCEGQLLPINQHQALFSLILTKYGGNGTTNFALPDLRGRVPIGAGQGPGLPNYTLGQVVGINQVALQSNQLPSHTHSVPGGQTGATGNGDPIDNVQQGLALHYLIAANGEIMIVPWEQQPTGWVRCSGQLLPVASYNYLFGHLGYSYGGGGPVFALPDLRGRSVVNYNGTSAPLIGEYRGTATHVLSLSDMPAHTHSISSGQTGSSGGPGGSLDNYQPSVVMKWLISRSGMTPHPDISTPSPYLGELRLVAGYVADGLPGSTWKPCDGTTYIELEDVVGNYGGDGKVPDLRGRLASSAATTLALPDLPVGSETFVVALTNLAPHSHVIPSEIGVEQPAGTTLSDNGNTVNFGELPVGGGPSTRTFTVTNSGVGDLLLGPIKKEGNRDDFIIGAPGATNIPPNGSTTFDVQFSPTATGTRMVELRIASNDADEDPFEVQLVGVGLTNQEAWRLQYFGSSANTGPGEDSNDFEKDGLSNALEFATGNDPTQSDAPPGTVILLDDAMEFWYWRSKAALADGFGFQVEFSDSLSLANWSGAGITEMVITDDPALQEVKATIPLDLSDSLGVVRLTVTPP